GPAIDRTRHSQKFLRAPVSNGCAGAIARLFAGRSSKAWALGHAERGGTATHRPAAPCPPGRRAILRNRREAEGRDFGFVAHGERTSLRGADRALRRRSAR